MLPDKTVVLGEASESDSEEISLSDHNQDNERAEQNDDLDRTNFSQKPTNSSLKVDERSPSPKVGGFGSSLLASIDPTSALSKLVSSYSMFASNAILAPSTSTRASSAVLIQPSRVPNDSQLSLLHKTLYIKNHQLHACLNHVFKHPYEKAFVDLNSISQRLVGLQKTLQNVDSDVLKLKRELKNLDFKPKMIF